ncbi:MAG: hypothetical protein L3J24_04845 [Xanthomonadales bacterium]|nr:hypothetical protein [Xanthomonadales bacterium]
MGNFTIRATSWTRFFSIQKLICVLIPTILVTVAAGNLSAGIPATKVIGQAPLVPLVESVGADDEELKKILEKVKDSLRENLKTIQFIRNQGQWPQDVLYVGKSLTGIVLVKNDRLSFITPRGNKSEDTHGMQYWELAFDGSPGSTGIVEGEAYSTSFSYFRGEDTTAGVKALHDITLQNVYAGIDLRLYGREDGRLEFDWIIAAGVDYKQIKLRADGHDGISLNEKDNLSIALFNGALALDIPESYQVDANGKLPVEVNFDLSTDNLIAYHVEGEINPDLPLIIDPVLEWGNWMDGRDQGPLSGFDEYLFAITVHPTTQEVYAAGATDETIPMSNAADYMGFVRSGGTTADGVVYPGVVPYDSTKAASADAIIYVFSANGEEVVRATHFGGNGRDQAYEIKLGPNGDVWIAGTTGSTDLPMQNPIDNDLDGSFDGFVAVFDPDLTTLRYSTYIGSTSGGDGASGSGSEHDEDIVSLQIIGDQEFWMMGNFGDPLEQPGDFIGGTGADTTYGGDSSDIYIGHFTSYSTLVYGTYVGGNDRDQADQMIVLNDGRVAFAGFTTSSQATFPTLVNDLGTVNGVVTAPTGNEDAIVGVIDPVTGGFSMLSRFVGNDDNRFVGISQSGAAQNYSIFVTGFTSSTDFSLDSNTATAHTPFQAANAGAEDIIIGRFFADGTAAGGEWIATYLGGRFRDLGNAVTQYFGGVFIYGTSNSSNSGGPDTGAFPTRNFGPAGTFFHSEYTPGTGGNEADSSVDLSKTDIVFAALNNTLDEQVFGTYLGGDKKDYLGRTGAARGANHIFTDNLALYLGTTMHTGHFGLTGSDSHTHPLIGRDGVHRADFVGGEVPIFDGFKSTQSGTGRDTHVVLKITVSFIGDFVWFDTNNNGIQDPGEPPIPGVEVCAFDNAGVAVPELAFGGGFTGNQLCATTDASGIYSFSSDDGLVSGDTYELRIDLSQAVDVDGDTVNDALLSDLLLSDVNVNQVTPGDAADQIDSDAGLDVGNTYATVTLVMPNEGFHTELADYGFVPGQLNHTKVVTQAPAITGNFNEYSIIYDITVTNTAISNTNGSGAVGVYSIADFERFGAGVTIVGVPTVTWSSPDVLETNNSAPPGYPQIALNEQLQPGNSETYTIEFIYTIPDASLITPDIADCDLLTGDLVRTGLLNRAILTTLGVAVDAFDCAPIPLGSIVIVKNTVAPSGDGTFEFPLAFTGGDQTLSITTVGGTGTTSVTGLAPGVYDLSETVPANWSLVSSSCDNGSTLPNVSVATDEVVTCTFTNTNLGTLIVRKQTLPDMDPQSFSFNGNIAALTGSLTDFDIAATELSTTITVGGGVIFTTETVPADWVLTDISCTGAVNSGIQFNGDPNFDPGDTTVAVDLAAGETVICTYTNTKDTILTLVKTITNNSGGTAAATDWTLNAAGTTPLSGVTGTPAVTNVVVTPGDYVLSETAGPAGYIASSWSCVGSGGGSISGATATLPVGSDTTCTINNDDQFAFLSLIKNVTNDNGGTAVATDWVLSAAGPTPLSGAGGVVLTAVNAGTYVLTEAGGPSGYAAGSWSCTAGTLTGNSLELALGQSATCTIINDDETAALTLTKLVTNDNGGTAVVTDWNLTATGPTNVSGAGGFAATFVDAGVYTLSESTGPAGYTAGAWSCTGGSLSGDQLTLVPGGGASCTIVNDDIAPTLTLTKVVNNDNGGIAVPSDFNLTVGGAAVVSGASNAYDANVAVALNETLVAGYSFVSITGDAACPAALGDTVTLAPGDNVSCTITNDDDSTFLSLLKNVTNDNGGTELATAWTVEAAGPTPLSGAGSVVLTAVDPGVYTLTETGGPSGYAPSTWACSGGSLAGNVLTLALGESAVCQITNDDIAPTLTLTKVVNNDNGGIAVPNDFNLMVGGAAVVSGVSNAYDANVALALNETLVAGYSFVSITGAGCPAALGDTVTLAPGDNVSCTITNDDDAVPSLTLVKTATPLTYSTVGEVISYTYDLTNSGNTDLFPVYAVIDDKATVTCPAGPATLVPLASVTCTAGYIITQADLDAGFVTNIAVGSAMDAAVSGAPVPSNQDTETVTASTNPAIDLLKVGTLNDEAPVGLNAGDTISYAFTVTNTGNVTLTGITLTDAIPGVTISGGTIATLAPGAIDSTTFTGTYTLTQADINAGTFTNTATVTGTPPNDPPVTDDDPDTQPLGGNPVLTLVKSASPATYNSVGVLISYEYDLTNAGNITLYPTYSVNDDKTTVVCPTTPAALAPGAFVTCTATYTITEADMLAGNVVNIASGTAQDAEVDGTPVVSNEDTEQVDVVRINLAKAVNGPAVLQGNGSYTVIYTITATNLGGGPGIYNLVDTFSPGVGITLNTATAAYLAGSENSQTGATGVYPNFVTGETLGDGLDEFWTVTANFTVDPAAIDPASSACDPNTPVINTGFYNFVTGSATDTDMSDNDACTGLPDPGINLAKVVNGAAVLLGNGTYDVVYTITASNSGAGPGMYDLVDTFSPGAGITLNTATAVYVAGTESLQTGTLAAYPNFVAGESLAAGLNESWTVTANFTVDPALVDPASSACDPNTPVINTGFYNLVTGSATDTDLSDNDACTGLPDPGINLAKVVNGPAVLLGNGTYDVVYTITASNSGAGPGMYDLVDTFSPGAGITLNTATAVYVAGTENAQTGTLAAYPNFVADESLAAGLNESWTVTANFTVDPTLVDPASSACDANAPVINTGFYNFVTGSATDTDLSDNDACTGLPDPGINLAKTVNGPATLENDGTYTVVYTVTATNTGQGPGVYDLVDTFSPAAGITLNTATAAYLAGTESDQSGTITSPFTNGATVVSGESLVGGMDESWTITANFNIDPALIDPATAMCAPAGTPAINTGFYNYVDGSTTETDFTDNNACTGLPEPAVNLAKTVNGPAVRGPAGIYTVVYTITATNTTNGVGTYDIVDTFTPGVGITLNTAEIAYAGGETQTGTITSPFNSGDTAVSGEQIGANTTETWTVTATFSIVLGQVTAEGNDCDANNAGGNNTGFTNNVSGSPSDNDQTDNMACTPFNPPSISLVKTADVATYAAIGDVINYTYLITNTGPDTLDPGLASVLDDQELVICPLPTPLPPNGTVTCTSLHTVTQLDLDNGTLTNIAVAMVDDVESNDDAVTVTAAGVTLLPPINVPTLSWQGMLAMFMLMLFGFYRYQRRSFS